MASTPSRKSGIPRAPAKTRRVGTPRRAGIVDLTLLRGIIEGASAPIFCLDRGLRYAAFNSAHARNISKLYGVSIGLGDRFLDHLVSKEERDEARTNMRRAFDGETFKLEVEIGTPDIGRRFLEVSHHPLRGPNGGVRGVAVFPVDITERRLAEAAVKAQAGQMRAILDTVAVGVLHVRDGRIVWSNPSMGRIFGVEGQMIGRTTEEFYLTSSEYHEFRNLAYDRLAKGEVVTAERKMRRTTGEVRWMRLTGRAIDPLADAHDAIWVVEDIHTQREMMDALRVRDDLLRKLSDQVPGLLYQFRYTQDGHASMPYASERIRDVFGTTPEAVRDDAMAVFKHIHPDDFDGLMRSIQQSAHDLSPWRHEFRGLLPGLGERWLLGDSKPEVLEDSSVLWHGYVTDITDRKRVEQVLADSEKRHRALFDTNPLPIWVFDAQTLRFLAVNEAAIEHYGFSQEEFLSMTVSDIWPAESLQAMQATLASVQHGHTERGHRIRHRGRDGKDIVVEASCEPIIFDGVRAVMVVAMDVTERLRAEEEIRLAEKVFDHSRQGIIITDAHARILRVNRAFERITGFSQDEVRGERPSILSSGRQARQFYEDMWRSLEEAGRWEGELWNRRKDGEVFPEFLAISAVRDAEGKITNYVGLFQDIGERKSAEERIQYLAHHDVLTGLPNRTLLRDRAEVALYHARRSGKPLGLVFIDLDRFKTINDSLGHEVGDHLLKHVSERILANVRAGDTVCRLGGDEFLILLPDIGEAKDASRLVDKLIDAVSAPYEIKGHELVVTCSAGIAVYPENGDDMDTLQRNADAAMYAAKNSGRNTSRFYSASMNAHALEYLTVERDLRHALERQELFLLYQPQFELATGRIVGIEALIRWHHPQRGLLAPAAFITIAEESGLIVPVGAWVLREACRELRSLAVPHGAGIPVAVNVSAVQFGRPEFPEHVKEALAESGIAPQLLELEVTESVIMHGPQVAIETLRQLDAMGLQIAIDDFGTGYSSLNYLRQLPVDKLKIDKSFIRDIPANADDMGIAEAIIGLAHTLKMRVIAEGVETREQADFLRARQCDHAQGYFFGRPVTMDEISRLIAKQITPQAA